MMERENINALDLEKIAFRMREKAFFQSALTLIKARHAFHPTLWSYGLFHNAVPEAREYLTHMDQIVNECGGPIDSARSRARRDSSSFPARASRISAVKLAELFR